MKTLNICLIGSFIIAVQSCGAEGFTNVLALAPNLGLNDNLNTFSINYAIGAATGANQVGPVGGAGSFTRLMNNPTVYNSQLFYSDAPGAENVGGSLGIGFIFHSDSLFIPTSISLHQVGTDIYGLLNEDDSYNLTGFSVSFEGIIQNANGSLSYLNSGPIVPVNDVVFNSELALSIGDESGTPQEQVNRFLGIWDFNFTVSDTFSLEGETVPTDTPFEVTGPTSGFTVTPAPEPSPPSLNIAKAGGQLAVSWPSSATNYLLQSNSALNSLTWSNFTGGFRDDGTNKSVSIIPTAGKAFFRLLNTNGP
jgi:hypothetical protein